VKLEISKREPECEREIERAEFAREPAKRAREPIKREER